ncbi:hypothetical protein [Mesorhizobium sp. M4B.F.Ca.ET.017.02.2.1]|uniref:hypothetical protein n=1 Tax=Mesorhizobium sp. M4B.F.Ca.ET.017.02.2.1 TaxID=2496649 RepID=UPI000FCB8D17|nr:hypothetical protein [Mesorhizobium sp. M4B.F.Ca.ET.017.02.2.1]RVD31777.1 hypothetical protein EN738_00175 [Mesorhizobium sp. M4B.F.Ca.ET.017.02.2.1]
MAYWKIQNFAAAVGQPTCYDTGKDQAGDFDMFVAISVGLTGFSEAELHSTGLVQTYFEELALILGRAIRGAFLEATANQPAAALASAIWRPLAQNLIRMWYLGQWKRLPATWARDSFEGKVPEGYNEFGRDLDRVISPLAYQEGLVWRAIGVNPPGAKQPGFASWTRRL